MASFKTTVGTAEVTGPSKYAKKITEAKPQNQNSKGLPKVLPKKNIATREVSNQVIKKPTEKKIAQKGVVKKSVASKYRTLYVMVYKDKAKTHEFKFLKDVSNHKNTALKWRTDKKIITKRLPQKDAIHIERSFSKIWGDTKFRSPSRVKKCTPYVNVASLLGKQVVCAENQKTAYQARNFLNELNLVFKASK